MEIANPAIIVVDDSKRLSKKLGKFDSAPNDITILTSGDLARLTEWPDNAVFCLDADASEKEDLVTLINSQQSQPAIVGVYDGDCFPHLQLLENGFSELISLESFSTARLIETALIAVARKLQSAFFDQQLVKRFFPLLLKSSDVLLILDDEGIVKFINPSAEVFFDLAPEQLLGKSFGIPSCNAVGTWLNLPRKKGQLRSADMRVTESVIDGKRYYVASLRNITEQLRIHEAVQTEKEQLAFVLESMGVGLICVDLHGKLILINSAAQELIGLNGKEAMGRDISDVLRISGSRKFKHSSEILAEIKEKAQLIHLERDFQIISLSGQRHYVDASINPMHNQENKLIGAVMVFQDTTLRRKMKEESLKAYKLESLGVLAGGIAHDYNNLLTSIMGNVGLAKLYAKSGSDVERVLKQSEIAIRRSRDLTQQLLTFSKGGAPVKEAGSIKNVLQETAAFALSGSNVLANFDIQNDLWIADFDLGQISQAVQNIVLNAAHAMPSGGNIDISARNIQVDSDNSMKLKAGPYIQIIIRDYGMGISAEHLSRIFDPYFTTKQKGSGLGLAVCYAVVKKHDGHINVLSESGSGTVFEIFLPAAPDKSLESSGHDSGLHHGEGRLLLVDDEQIVLDTASQILNCAGYTTAVANGSQEALQKYRQAASQGESFDLVILDLTLPGDLSGDQILKALMTEDPEIKAVVSSGYSDNDVLCHYHDYGFSGVVPKPYAPEELTRVVAQIVSRDKETAKEL